MAYPRIGEYCGDTVGVPAHPADVWVGSDEEFGHQVACWDERSRHLLDESPAGPFLQEVCVESGQAVDVLSVTGYPRECDLHQVPVVLIHGDGEQECHGRSASGHHPVDSIQVWVGVADPLGLGYNRVVVEYHDVAGHLVELVDVGCTQVGDDHAVRLRVADGLHVHIVQCREECDPELLACTHERLRHDGRSGHPVGVIVGEHLDEVVAADDVCGLRKSGKKF